MALTDGNANEMIMPVQPLYGGNNGYGNGFGGDWAWIILLLLLGWGNGAWGGFGGGFGNMALSHDFPWLLNGQNGINANTNAGFQNAMLNDGITSIRDGLYGLSTQLCNCCSDTQMALANGFAGIEQGANARQMANMQQMFDLSTQFSNCCCENRLANCQTQNVIQTEGAATRFADLNNTRDIMENCNRNNQAILDKLCQLELDAKNDKISDLERELTMANLSASQNIQTQQLLADNFAQTNALEQYLAPTPRPAYIVQNPNCCTNNTVCGCGM